MAVTKYISKSVSKETFIEASKVVVKPSMVINLHSFMHYYRPKNTLQLNTSYVDFSSSNLRSFLRFAVINKLPYIAGYA